MRFQSWLALPPADRKPATQSELAGVLGITEFTLSRWKRLSGFGNEVYEIAREELKGGQLAAILQAQAKVAQSEVSYATQAARFVFEAAGMLSKGPAVSVEGEKVLIVSRDGLDAGI